MEDIKKEEKIIFDINISSIQDLYSILLNKWYDFVTLEPEETKVYVRFRKEWKVVDERFIRYPIYSEILIKAKTTSNLDVWETKETQEWTWEMEIDWKKYNLLSKVVPWNYWEKLFLKVKVIEEKIVKKSNKKMELGKMVGAFWALLIILLIIGWSYLAFIVLNAKTIDDVRFFLSLWINIDEINNFLEKAVTIFFSLLVLILTIFLAIFLFKFLLTKKIYKKKKAKYGVIALLFFIITFSSASWWMIIYGKIKDLPNWWLLRLWDVRIYDNSKLASEIFREKFGEKNLEVNAFISDTTNIIWPIDIKFDISEIAKKEEKWWLRIKKYIWSFWRNERIEESFEPSFIKKFDKKGNYDVEVEIELVDELNQTTTKKLKNMPKIWVWYIVWIRERQLNNGSKQVTFDATTLKDLWKAEWFLEDSKDDEPTYKWSVYTTKPIFEETIVWLKVRNDNKSSNQLDRIFVINWEQAWNISWDIEFTKSNADDKEYTFQIKNIRTNEWMWTIEKFVWKIEDRQYTRDWDIDNLEKSSEVKHKFGNYWKYDITVELTPTSWEIRKITKKIDVIKELKIKDKLTFYSNWEKVENVIVNDLTWEYFLNEFWIPTTLSMDARYVKSDNIIYSLEEVTWDYDSDWNIDAKGKKWELVINKEWKNKITVRYKFRNIRLDDDVIEIKEIIYVEAVKKEHDINFKINQSTEYAPAIIWFDATQSMVKDSNISKFIWNFWDQITEEWDAVIKHRYLADWEYQVSLTVVTSDWKRYSTSKKVVLKPKAQKVKIKSSLLNAPIHQWIDFDSSESIWDITNYLWDFGDGNISTEANPTHSYSKAWTYKVKLTVDFRNRNVMEDQMEITITN